MRRPVAAIHQPNLLPWLGWFAKAAQADVMVLLDDVQLERSGPTQRVLVKSREGPKLVTVPVRRGAGSEVRIDAAQIAHDGRWDVHAARVLENAYHRTPGWERHGRALAEAIRSRETSLAVFNERLIRYLAEALGVTTRFVRASELGPRTERGNLGNLEICRRIGAATYLSGSGARKYNDPAPFADAGIGLVYSAFEHPVYAQPHGSFVPGLSAIDAVFSVPDDAPALLRAGIRPPSAS